MKPRVLLVFMVFMLGCHDDKDTSWSWVTVGDFVSQDVDPTWWQFSYVMHDGASYDNVELQGLTDAVYDPADDDVAFPDAGLYKGAWLRLALMDSEEAQPFGEVLLLKQDDWIDDSVTTFRVAFDNDGNLLHQSEQLKGSVRVRFTVNRFVKER